MDFRDVQHNPELAHHLKDLNHVNESIATVHADHIGVTTFTHEVKYTIDDIGFGLDQSCEIINIFSDECDKHINSCQYVNEGIAINEKAIRKYIQILNVFERVCTLEDFPVSEIVISRCRRGKHWSTFNPKFEIYSYLKAVARVLP